MIIMNKMNLRKFHNKNRIINDNCNIKTFKYQKMESIKAKQKSKSPLITLSDNYNKKKSFLN